MTTEMIVNVSPRETRAALLENGVLQELFVERASRMGLTGNLYKGRVSRVLPGMQAAFIDIGLERTAFLHVSDIVQPADAEGSGEETRTENIRELVSEGGDILVQVLKDPLGTKGARLTTFITIPSRYLVYMPFGHGVGISARIETEEERLRLRELMQSFVTPGRGGRLHRAHRSGRRDGRGTARRHAVPAQALGSAVDQGGRHARGHARARRPAAAAAPDA